MKNAFFPVRFFLVFSLFSFFSFQAAPSFAEETESHEFASSASCKQCHGDIYESWKNSLHAQSLSDPVFKAAYIESYYQTAGESKALCLKCHAPIARENGDYDLKLPITQEGITCDFCHSVTDVKIGTVGNEFILDSSNTKHGPLKNPTKTKSHASTYSPLHLSAKFCGGCHEYINEHGVSVMSTFSEWKNGPYEKKGITCQNCHMPLVEGDAVTDGTKNSSRRINSHDIAGGHNIKQLQKALKIKVEKIIKEANNKIIVRVSITNVGSGHRVPTGIPSRKVLLKVSLTQNGKVRGYEKREYRKELLDINGNIITNDADLMGTSAVQVGFDNRIFPKEKREEAFVFFVPDSNVKLKAVAKLSYSYKPLLLTEEEITVELGKDQLTK